MIIYYFDMEDEKGNFKHDEWNKICDAKWTRPQPASAAPKKEPATPKKGKRGKATGKRGRGSGRK